MKNLIILSILCVLLLSSCSSDGENIQTEENSKSVCPNQGTFQSDMDYCIELCMLNHGDAGYMLDACNQICESIKYADGTEGLQQDIQDSKCDKCGECTQEQLTDMENKKKADENAKLAEEKRIKDYNKQEEEKQLVKEEQLKIKEQQKIELDRNIEIQSQKNGGYVYLRNIGGEPTQWEDSGIIYEFPFPTKDPVKVPVNVGRTLLTNPNFELVIV